MSERWRSDPATGNREGYFWAMMAAAGDDEHRYFETFYERAQDAALRPRLLYYPDYYRTMVTRLYLYGSRAAQPRESTFVAISILRRYIQSSIRVQEGQHGARRRLTCC